MSAATAALAVTALAASPASADTAPSPGGCPDVPTVQPFAPWQDHADYFLAPGGDFEAGGSGWRLEDGASIVEGNEPFGGAPGDHRSLSLPAGASAATAPMCIGEEHRTMRYFAVGARTGSLAVEAVYTKANGTQKRVPLGVAQGTGEWGPSDVVPMRVNELAGDGDALSVSLRFSARGNTPWQVDDVYVDPYKMK